MMGFDVTWILAGVSLFGSFLNAKKKIACFYVWAVGEVLWCVLDMCNHCYGRATLDIISFLMAIYGIYSWSSKKSIPKSPKRVRKHS